MTVHVARSQALGLVVFLLSTSLRTPVSLGSLVSANTGTVGITVIALQSIDEHDL